MLKSKEFQQGKYHTESNRNHFTILQGILHLNNSQAKGSAGLAAEEKTRRRIPGRIAGVVL